VGRAGLLKKLGLESLRLLWVHGCAAASTTAPILSAFNQDKQVN
jgi:hypothetical protein